MYANVNLLAARPLVLVVDDSRLVRWKVRTVLEGAGFEVAEAEDGIDAMTQARARRPAMVLMDRTMPRLDGHGALQAMRSDTKLHGVPVVMLTSNAAEADRQAARDLGANGFVGKPFDDGDLVATVRDTLDARKRRSRREPGAGPRVLLVDDAGLMRARLARALRPAGMEVFEAGDGAEALLQARAHMPDVVLMDVNMPGMCGLEAARRMRTDAELHHLPIILLSANKHPQDIRRAFEVGANDYMVKPFEDAAIVERIKTLAGQPAA